MHRAAERGISCNLRVVSEKASKREIGGKNPELRITDE